MQQLEKGPFVHAIGYVFRPEFEVHSAVIPGQPLAMPVVIENGGKDIRTLGPLTPEEMMQPLPKEVLRASGVARARNSARSTIYAALVAKEFNNLLADVPGYNPDRVVIGITNCSASGTISWEYETEGVTMGWRYTNTMLMPSALPSAIGTQISSAISTHNATITFLNDMLGMCAAIEYTHVNFFHDRADYAFIIAAEELSPPHLFVQEHTKEAFLIDREGGAGILFSREKLGDSAWQLALYHHAPVGEEVRIPEAWKSAKVMDVSLPESKSPFSSLVFPIALHTLFGQGDDKVIFKATIANRSTYAFGFQLAR